MEVPLRISEKKVEKFKKGDTTFVRKDQDPLVQVWLDHMSVKLTSTIECSQMVAQEIKTAKKKQHKPVKNASKIVGV
jgi:hypothetical protein